MRQALRYLRDVAKQVMDTSIRRAGRADARVMIPLCPPARSLNVAFASAITLAETLRQTAQLPSRRVPAG
jgi:tRNA(Leu) C34 or U34 (ribose-2'-O)-methylase TrmL